jgi:hypothetical protein
MLTPCASASHAVSRTSAKSARSRAGVTDPVPATV